MRSARQLPNLPPRALAAAIMAPVLLVCGVAGWAASSFFSAASPGADDDALNELAFGALWLAVLLVCHALTLWWLLTHRLKGWAGLAQWVLTQVPFLTAYTMLYIWYKVPFGFGEAPALFWLPWMFFALSALGWLLVWWTRTDRRNPRRAILFLVLLALLLAGNGIAGFRMAWKDTYGFGLAGEDDPRSAFNAAGALSCLNHFGGPFYDRHGKLVQARCPQGHTADRRYDPDGGHDPDLSRLLDGSQPEQAFARWWQFQSDYEYYTELEFWDEEPQTSGNEAEMRVRVKLRVHRIPEGHRRFKLNKTEEVWVVSLRQVPAGGWKLTRIEVPDPVTVTDLGIPEPSASPSASSSPRVWDTRVPWYCFPDAPYRDIRDCEEPPADWEPPGPYYCAPDQPFGVGNLHKEECRELGWDV